MTLPQSEPVENPVMTQDQSPGLVDCFENMHGLFPLQVGMFCGPRASEVTGLQSKSWMGEALQPYGEGAISWSTLAPHLKNPNPSFGRPCGKNGSRGKAVADGRKHRINVWRILRFNSAVQLGREPRIERIAKNNFASGTPDHSSQKSDKQSGPEVYLKECAS